MKTGLTVDFRNRDILRDAAEEGGDTFILYPQDIKEEHEYVVTEQKRFNAR